MQAFVMTRASRRRSENRFLGASPDEGWWRRYDRLTIFEQPTMILERAEGGWRFFATAIPSGRHETEGRNVRFSLAAEGDYDEGNDADAVVRIVESWLNDGGGDLGRRLDEEFPEELVTPVYETPPPGPEYEEDVRARLARVLEGLPPAAEEGPGYEGSWLADASSPAGRAGLSARCREVIAGQSLLAAVFNTAEPEDLAELAADGDVAALIPEGPQAPAMMPGTRVVVYQDEAADVEPPGKARSQGLTTRLKRTLATRNGKLAAGGAGLSGLAIVTALMIWIGPL